MNHSTPSDSLAYRIGHQVFVVGLLLKAVNALLELVIGGLLLLLPFDLLKTWAQTFSRWVASVLPEGWAGHMNSVVDKLSSDTVSFVAWYFLSHGILKGVVIACLVQGKQWAYPLGIAIFLGFGVYQTWEYFLGGSVFYLFLDVLDVALIGLTAVEWVHAVHAARAVDKASPDRPS